jgi:glycosyltransferase 2 family protein
MNKQRLGSLVGAAIGIAGIVFVVRRVARDWDDFSDAIASASPAWVACGLVFGLAAMSMIGWNWFALLRSNETASDFRRGATWFFVGQLGKYVPGGIWPIVGQAELATRAGTSRSQAYSATALSMLATLLGAAVFGVGAAMVSSFDHRLIASIVGGALLAGFVLLGSARVRQYVHRVAARVTRRRLELPESRVLAVATARHLPVWFCFAMVNICVFRALGGSVEFRLVVELAVATCVSWIAGFVVVGVPGGLGVREAVFVSMMTGPVGASIALSIAVVSRAVSISADLLGAAGALAFAPRSSGMREESAVG